MKRFALVALCLAFCVTAFSGCSEKKSTVLEIGEAKIDSEIFAYYFDEAYAAVESEGGDLLDTAAIMESAVDRCCEHVGAVTLFSKLNLALSTGDKRDITNATDEMWMLYGSFFNHAGISRQTVYEVQKTAQMRTALLLYYFGEGSEYEVSEEEIEYYFDKTYVQFYAVNGYLTTVDENGNSVPLGEEAAAAIREEFAMKKQRLDNGATLEEVNAGNAVDPSFVAVTNSAYPEGFLQQVAELSYDEAAVIEMQDYIFLVVRTDAKQGEENYYRSYRTSYIEALRGEMLSQMLVETGKEYSVEREESKLEKIGEGVIDARNSRK